LNGRASLLEVHVSCRHDSSRIYSRRIPTESRRCVAGSLSKSLFAPIYDSSSRALRTLETRATRGMPNASLGIPQFANRVVSTRSTPCSAARYSIDRERGSLFRSEKPMGDRRTGRASRNCPNVRLWERERAAARLWTFPSLAKEPAGVSPGSMSPRARDSPRAGGARRRSRPRRRANRRERGVAEWRDDRRFGRALGAYRGGSDKIRARIGNSGEIVGSHISCKVSRI
jgi:hypothetical protein